MMYGLSRMIFLLLALVAQAASAATADQPERLIALGGDVTTTVYLLAADQRLVGVDMTSQWPETTDSLPNVGYLRQLHTEGILSLRPTQIIASHDAGPPLVLSQLRQAGVSVQLLDEARDPATVISNLRQIGQWLGQDKKAETLAQQLEQHYQQLASSVAAMGRRPKALFLLAQGNGSPMVAGRKTAADSVITLAGGRNVATGFDGYKPISAESVVRMAPEIIMLMNASKQTIGGIDGVLALPGMRQTPAGQQQRIHFVDGQALLGFGPRNAEAEMQLQQALEALQ